MDFPILYPALEGQNVVYRTAGLFRGGKVLLSGTPVEKIKGVYLIPTKDGSAIALRLKRTFFDPTVPNAIIGADTIYLAPRLKWYETAWATLPLLLFFWGGAVGALVGAFAVITNSRIFRGNRSLPLKYALSGLVSVGAVAAFVIIVVALQIALRNYH